MAGRQAQIDHRKAYARLEAAPDSNSCSSAAGTYVKAKSTVPEANKASDAVLSPKYHATLHDNAQKELVRFQY